MAHLSGSNGSNGFSGNFQPEPTGKKAVEGPGLINYGHDIDSELYPLARSVKENMLKQIDRVTKVNGRRAMVDRRMTAFANDLGIEKVANDEFTGMLNDIEDMRRSMKGLVERAETALKAKTECKPGDLKARELRDRLMSLSPEDRIAAFREAAANSDRDVLGAVVGLSRLQTGIDPAITGPLFEDWQRRTAPVEHRTLSDMRKYAGYVEALPRDAHAWHVRSLSGTEASAAAQARFDAIFNNPADKADKADPEPEAE